MEDKIECIVFDYSELNSYEFESYKEYNLPEENLIYRFNKTEAIDFEKRKDIEIIEAECCKDHIHMLVKIPPKYSVLEIMGYLKRKLRSGASETIP